MTISSETRKAGPYTGNGVTTSFPFAFKVFTAADVLVVRTNLSNVDSNLTLTSDYTVALNADQNANPGGTITLVGGALTTGFKLTMTSQVGYTQGTDLQNQGGFYPAVINAALDRLTILAQQLKEGLSRAAKLPISNTTDADALVADIVRLADSANNIDIVANDKANVDAVAGNATNINTVAGNNANISTVAGISANVTTVAGNTTNVNTVATNVASVNTAASNIAAIIDAPNQATAAAASAAAAAASAASGMYSAVQDKSADYTVVVGDAGDLIRITTTGGARTITLPQISTVSDGFKVAIVKWTGDTNQVTINRSGSDTINGAASATIGSQYTQITFVADFETNQWFAATSGLGSTNVVVDTFNGGGTTFTLSGDPGSKNNTYLFIGGAYQQKSTYSVSGTTLTTTSTTPAGTNNVEVVWTQPLAIGTPSDGTVSTAKLQAGALAASVAGLAKMADGFFTATSAALAKFADGFFSADATGRAKMADGFVTAAKLAAGAAVSNIGAGGITTTQLAVAAVTSATMETLVQPLGVGQTWQDVKASRAHGTTYTNTTGRPIYVYVYNSIGTNATFTITVNGVAWNGYYYAAGNAGTPTFIVPSGGTYRVDTTASLTVANWMELR